MPRSQSARQRRSATPSSGSPTHAERVGDLDVRIEPTGPGPEKVEALGNVILKSAPVRKMLGRARHRLLGLTFLEEEAKKSRSPAESHRFRAVIYDYTNERTLLVDGDIEGSQRFEVTESAIQPLPSAEEYAAAVASLRRDRTMSSVLADQTVQPYPAMPPLVGEELPDGRRRRMLAVGLLPSNGRGAHEIVGVSPDRGEIARFERGAPVAALAHADAICGVPYAAEDTISSAPGQVLVTVRRAGQLLWRFRAVRPAASSGTNGSGIELRHVDYRGTRVLYRGHVPFLNVKYEGDACGPYRDWQNQEGKLHAVGTDVGPGFRFCSSPATTVLQTGDDSGSFLGTAIYVDGHEVVLVCEMEAGWYRYISEWRLHADGTIRPRFGFGAVSSSCVCTPHHHHVYWRFDFDIRTAGDNVVREFNDPPLTGSSKWHTQVYEARRRRDPARKRRWRVLNAATRQGYDILPSASDGQAAASPDAPFGRGDVWITRYRSTEIDDGVYAVGPPYEVDIDRFVNGERVANADVVFWYGAHFTHDVREDASGMHGHVVGPDLKPVGW